MDFSPINDFFSNIKDKLTNPFFGTLIIVWLTRNWELVYSIFNFDKNLNLKDKITFINSYFDQKSFWSELGVNVGLAIVFMIIGYFLIVATRSISIIVEHNIMPFITNKLINKNVVLKTDYDIVVNERDDYFEKYENERIRVRKFSDDYDSLSDNYKSTTKQYTELSTLSQSTYTELEDKRSELEIIKKKESDNNEKIENLNEKIEYTNKELSAYSKDLIIYRSIFEHNTLNSLNFLLSNPDVLITCKQLIKDNSVNNFCDVASFYINGGTIGGEAITKLAAYNVLHDRSSSQEGLNTLGELIYKYIFKNYKNLKIKQISELHSKIMYYDDDE